MTSKEARQARDMASGAQGPSGSKKGQRCSS
jgi:hypothetical protein